MTKSVLSTPRRETQSLPNNQIPLEQGAEDLRDRYRSSRIAYLLNFRSLLPNEQRRRIAAWLIYGADPQSLRSPPSFDLTPMQVNILFSEAEAHGVLPSVFSKTRAHLSHPQYEDGLRHASERLVLLRSHTMMLRACCDTLTRRMQGLPFVTVKGRSFATTIYPDPALRPYTDVDFLAAPEALAEIEAVLKSENFVLAAPEEDGLRQEWKWQHSSNPALLVEVHTNMVHAESLRSAASLPYRALERIGAQSPAAMLGVAVTHGALHQFERLRYLVDIIQAARMMKTAEDEKAFVDLVEISGMKLGAVTGLKLAYKLFGEPRCMELVHAVGKTRYALLAHILMRPSVVTSSMNEARTYHAWRRQGFRELLKRDKALPSS